MSDIVFIACLLPYVVLNRDIVFLLIISLDILPKMVSSVPAVFVKSIVTAFVYVSIKSLYSPKNMLLYSVIALDRLPDIVFRVLFIVSSPIITRLFPSIYERPADAPVESVTLSFIFCIHPFFKNEIVSLTVS